MSSEIAISWPGVNPARSIARISASSAASLVSKAGQNPPSSATPCSRPRSAMIAAGREINFGGPFERLIERGRERRDDHEILDVDPPARHARRRRKSGFPAAASPPRPGRRADRRRAACRARRRRRAARPSTPRPARCRRAGFSAACRRARSSARVDRGLVAPHPCPISAAAISPLIAATAPLHVAPAEPRAAVAQLDRLAGAGRGARRRDRPPDGAAGQTQFGLDGRPAARIPNPAAMHARQCASRSSTRLPDSPLAAQASRTAARRSTGSSSSARATRRTRSLSDLERDVFDRRLAVDPRQQQPRQQVRGARFEHLRRLPGDAAEIGLGEPVEAGEKAGDRLSVPQAFQQQVVEAEREVEGRVAVPGAFGVEEHRPARTDQDVFRADIAMHQSEAGAGGRPAPDGRAARRDRDARGSRRSDTARCAAHKSCRRWRIRARSRDRRPSRRGCGASRSPTEAALAGSACPSRSRYFQTGYAPGSRYSIANIPFAASSPSSFGTASGQIAPATRNQAAS